MVENRYLQGNFAPVHIEVTATDLPVSGSIPEALEGRYLRIGPNPAAPPDPVTYHWFGGDGMVHGVRLRGGRAEWYRNRWVRSNRVAEALGESPPEGPVHAGMDTVNTNVIGHAGRTWALVEAGAYPVELSDELDTVGRNPFFGTLPGAFTAHPKLDPVSGELHAVAYWWGWDHLQYLVVGTDARVRRTVDVPVADGPMVHDMGLTERSVLLLDLPVTFDLSLAGSGYFPYRWNPDHGARVGVLPREGGPADVRWCEVDLCYVYHPLNAYDLPDGRIVMDVVRHPKMFATDVNGPNEGDPVLVRWIVDPAAGRVAQELLDDRGQEFPRMDPRLVGRRHTIGWGASFGPGAEHGGLLKHDVEKGTTQVHSYGPGRATLEPVFVPRPGGTGEEDGWVLSVVHDATTDTSDLVILDAGDLSEVAAVHLPQRVPFGFHGNWVPDEGGW